MIGDVWRIPPSYPYVIVNRDGVVKRPDGTLMHQYRSGAGYMRVQLKRGGLRRRAYVHRLVAECFVKKPDGNVEINHRNGDKKDNRADNLEWVTRSENLKHAWRIGLCRRTEAQQEASRRNIQIAREAQRLRRMRA